MNAEKEERSHYAISEVGELTDLEPHVLRFWQGEFEELQPQKNDAGQRVYTQEDVAIVRRIKHLLRREKYTIEGARQVLARRSPSADRKLRKDLKEMRGFLTNLLEEM